jgi:HEAT repeat protein
MSIRALIDRMYHGDLHSAREEARQVADLGALAEIRAILDKSKDTPEKKFCYWILGDLGRNTGAQEVMDYLMERVGKEKTATLRKQALQEILFLRGPSDPQNVVKAAQDKNRGVREAAVAALGACTHPAAEQALIQLVESGGDERAAVRNAAVALARAGTEKCASALVALLDRLPRDRAHETAVAAALLALSRIRGPDALPLALSELGQSRQPFPNWASMLVIEQHGNEGHIDVVIERLSALLQRRNRPDVALAITFVDTRFEDELSAGAAFLRRIDGPRVDQFFQHLREKAASLSDREKRLLANSAPGLDEFRSDESDSGR